MSRKTPYVRLFVNLLQLLLCFWQLQLVALQVDPAVGGHSHPPCLPPDQPTLGPADAFTFREKTSLLHIYSNSSNFTLSISSNGLYDEVNSTQLNVSQQWSTVHVVSSGCISRARELFVLHSSTVVGLAHQDRDSLCRENTFLRGAIRSRNFFEQLLPCRSHRKCFPLTLLSEVCNVSELTVRLQGDGRWYHGPQRHHCQTTELTATEHLLAALNWGLVVLVVGLLLLCCLSGLLAGGLLAGRGRCSGGAAARGRPHLDNACKDPLPKTLEEETVNSLNQQEKSSDCGEVRYMIARQDLSKGGAHGRAPCPAAGGDEDHGGVFSGGSSPGDAGNPLYESSLGVGDDIYEDTNGRQASENTQSNHFQEDASRNQQLYENTSSNPIYENTLRNQIYENTPCGMLHEDTV